MLPSFFYFNTLVKNLRVDMICCPKFNYVTMYSARRFLQQDNKHFRHYARTFEISESSYTDRTEPSSSGPAISLVQ